MYISKNICSSNTIYKHLKCASFFSIYVDKTNCYKWSTIMEIQYQISYKLDLRQINNFENISS